MNTRSQNNRRVDGCDAQKTGAQREGIEAHAPVSHNLQSNLMCSV